MTVEEKLNYIRGVAMEEARAKGNSIIKQHQDALEELFKTHREEQVRQSENRIKAETSSAKRQLNAAASKRQGLLRRERSEVHFELKKELFKEVEVLLAQYKEKEEYKELLVSYIARAARIANGQSFVIYLDPEDKDKKEYLENRTGMTITMSQDSFFGGIRAVIPERNILIDYSFQGAIEKEYNEFTFKGGAGIE